MAIRNKVYSYPYYANFVDDYLSVDFEVDCDYVEEGNETIINISVKINDEILKKEIENGNIGIAALTQCPNTIYRKSFSFEKGKYSHQFKINKNELDEKVKITIYLYAIKDFIYSNSKNLNNMLKELSFKIEKGNIIGESSSDIELYVHHLDTSNSSSIFTRSFDDKLKESDEPYIEYRQDSIDIVMPREMYKLVNKMDYNSKNYAIIHSTYLIPALTQVIASLVQEKEEDNTFIEENEGNKWLNIIIEKLKQYDDLENISKKDAWKYAQLILKNPVNHLSNEWLEKRNNLGLEEDEEVEYD